MPPETPSEPTAPRSPATARRPSAVNRLMLRLFPATLASQAGTPAEAERGWLTRRLGLAGKVFISRYGRMPRGEFARASLIVLCILPLVAAVGGVIVYFEPLPPRAPYRIGLPPITVGGTILIFLLVWWPASFCVLWLKRLADVGLTVGGGLRGWLILLSYLLLAGGIVLFYVTHCVPIVLLPHLIATILFFAPRGRAA